MSFNNKKVAIIIGNGDLPIHVIKSAKVIGIDFSIVRFKGVYANKFSSEDIIEATFENISDLFSKLKLAKFNAVAFCGYMPRPELNINKLSINSRIILEPIIRNFGFGDEAVFSSILNLFDTQKLRPITIYELAPNLFPSDEFLTKLKPTDFDLSDTKRAEQILNLTSVADLGQSLVVSQGACLAIETAPGTDAMLNFLRTVKKNDSSLPKGGIFYKAPKKGQNQFIDQPVIGIRTIKAVYQAGLNGIVIKRSKVICLDLKKILKLADELGVFIWSKN